MAIIDNAFTVDEHGVFLNFTTAVLTEAADPSTGLGETAPIGSIYLRTNGVLYVKTAAANTDWTTVPNTADLVAGYQPLNTNLTGLSALATTGVMIRTGAGTFTTRIITGTTNRITVTSGDGVAGNPTVDISSTYVGQASITTLGTITTGVWNGTTIAVANGGTGLTTTPTNGQLLIGNGTGYTLATLTSGTGISVVNGAGTITINTTGLVPTTRLINTTAPLAGGGDLSADRTLSINTNGITNALFRQSAALSVVGNPTNATANVTDITAGADFNILRRSGTAIGFGSIDLSQSGAVGASVLGATNGGTGQSVYVVGDILYANTTTTLARLADIATGNALISGGVGVAPLWGKIGLTTHVSGTLPIANGGTQLTTTPTNGQLLIGNGTTYTLATLTAGTNISITNGAGSITVNTTGLQAALVLYRENPSAPTTPTASGTNAVSIGNGNTASGTESIALGGLNNTAGAQWSTAIGSRASTGIFAGFVQSSGRFAADGDAQTTVVVLRQQTTNNTAQVEMFIDGVGGSQRLVLPNDTTWAFRAMVVARRADANDESAAYEFSGCIDRNATAGSTAIVGVRNKTIIAEDTGAWDADLNADTTNGALRFHVTGQNAKTINWVCRVELTQVTG